MEDKKFIGDDNNDLLPKEGVVERGRVVLFFLRHLRRLLQRDEDTGRNNIRALISLFVLFIISVLNQADRWVLAVLLPYGMRCPYEENSTCSNSTVAPYTGACLDTDGCISMSDSGQGLLTGTAFTVVYVLAGIPLACCADKKSRVVVLVGGLIVWSLMCFCTGFVRDFWALLLLRMGLGLGEASCNPIAYSLISDYFLPQNRATALAVYTFGIYVGEAVGYTSSVLNHYICWRWIFKGLGIFGLAMVPIVLLVIREPKHQEENVVGHGNKQCYTIKETVVYLITCWPFLMLLLASSVRNLPGYALGGWLPTFFSRDLKEPGSVYGWKNALIVLTGGCLGAILGGYLADRAAKTKHDRKSYVISVSQVIAGPAIVGTLLAHNADFSYFMLFLAYITAETWIGPATSIVQDICMPAIRSQASAVYIAIITLIGGQGPLVVAAFLESGNTGLFGECSHGVRNALLFTVPTFYVVSACLFFFVGLLLRQQQSKLFQEERIHLAADSSTTAL